ncbi:hypothetical protein [Alkalihalobacillus trypoxylicola]|uniref:hypothetical protein n=1 Tax=Alkalihalobacillus trypoxylicola TaxID=519424 RepID=UPI000A701E3C|nr:hypothetical protein [Alkalihalobacillus trypoxylicola]
MVNKENKDTQHEGRDEYFMDIERMINEGLGSGTVSENQAGWIEEARDLEKEDPPKKNK